MKSSKYLNAIILIASLFVFSCQSHKNIKAGEGFIDVPGGKVWYKIYGSGDKTPLLVLHGGPGIPHYYLKTLSALSKDRPVIFYDQLGCGRSDKITDTSIINVKHYVNELDVVVKKLGLKDYYLLGQSWGTMLGTDFYLEHPQGIKALILSSPAISIPMWLKDADTLIATLPDTLQMAIRTNEQNKTYNNPQYQNAVKIYYEHFLARKLPWSADIDSCFMQMGENVYVYMGGPSEFTVVGELKNYDRTKRLHEIKVPTLFITGQYDEARPSTVKYYSSLVPGSKYVEIENSGHMTSHDNPDKNNEAVSSFLNDLEKK